MWGRQGKTKRQIKTTYLCHFIPGRPADLAEVLRDQQGGRRKLEFLLVDVVKGLARFEARGDRFIDFFHGHPLQIQNTLDYNRFLLGLRVLRYGGGMKNG